MARRTKEDALATRDSILDAAEQLFVKQGVSGTTLQHIATAAGVTRGAIYWHFLDKGAMFNAMMERVKMPLESAMLLFDQANAADPIEVLRESMMRVFRMTVEDPMARRVFEIATLKMEFTDELNAVRERRKLNQASWMARTESRVREGIANGQVKAGVEPYAVALGLWAIIDGLLRAWLLDPQEFDLIALGTRIVDTHLESLRAKPD
ncbi:TetR family transcriptional regulator [Massilia psychrophila]|jgi:TetR/AcrR family acrAB operon transcriptional repressor|uniref:TetR family transcriptional regulator n=1 Tax=Massilia psychrophila TaxID=1603353 RepID=A0A2G8SZB4_9BURK|nr:TetR family transcriptional regulator [Massilia psychrophila]GGE85096.1 TetR family transcriptional regulator [Massilia psychrophila]